MPRRFCQLHENVASHVPRATAAHYSKNTEKYTLQEATETWAEASHHSEVSSVRQQQQKSFHVAHNTISLFIPEVCQALIDEYQGEVFAFPTNPDEWKEVTQKYCERWSFHHPSGALGRKHIAIRSPRHSGTLYYSYKGFFSIILLALVDADYKFIWADVGAQGSSSDAQIFNHGPPRNRLENGTPGLPYSEPLPHDDRPIPYF